MYSVFILVDSECRHSRGGAASLGKQPKSVASSADGTVFVTELEQIEVYKQCQKVAEIPADYGPNGIDVSVDGLIAVGGDVRKFLPFVARNVSYTPCCKACDRTRISTCTLGMVRL